MAINGKRMVWEKSIMTFIEAYREFFDNFIASRKLDLDDLLWSDEVRAAYAKEYAALCTKYDRKPL